MAQLVNTRTRGSRHSSISQDRGDESTPFLRRSRRRPMATTKGFATACKDMCGVLEQSCQSHIIVSRIFGVAALAGSL